MFKKESVFQSSKNFAATSRCRRQILPLVPLTGPRTKTANNVYTDHIALQRPLEMQS